MCTTLQSQNVSVALGGPHEPGKRISTVAMGLRTAAKGPARMATLPMAATPQLSVAAGYYASAQSVSITDSTPGATIYYSRGAIPVAASGFLYSGPVSITTTTTIVAMAVAPGYAASDLAIATYYVGTAQTPYVYTIAGTDFWGYEGDGGLATRAVLNNPNGVAVDSAGNVYISDTTNNRVRKIDGSTGRISTIAGTGVRGFGGDGGPAISAQLSGPTALAMDSPNGLYVADEGNEVVRRIDLGTGTITTFAGNPNATTPGDGGPPTSASIRLPSGLAFDWSGNLYISTWDRIRKVDRFSNTISTVAGGGLGSVDDVGLAVNANVFPNAVAVDGPGWNLYISDRLRGVIRRVDLRSGIISPYAGLKGLHGYSGDGGPAVQAMLNSPSGLTVDKAGNLYIADGYNFRIRKVDANTGVISTTAGIGGCFKINGDGSPAAGSALCYLTGMAFDQAGKLYMAEPSMSRVKKMTLPMTPPTKFTAAPVLSLASGTYSTAQTLTITDSTPGAAIYVTTSGYSPPTGIEGYHGPFQIPGTLTVKAVAVAPGYMISEVAEATYTITAPARAVVNLAAGNGTPGFAGWGGPATSAEIRTPSALAADSSGVYIADDQNNVVWKVDSNSGNIALFAGTGAFGYAGDGGPANKATFIFPDGLAVDSAGNLFIADSGNSVVREVTAATGKIKTVAGNGTSSYTGSNGPVGDGGPATEAWVNHPSGLAVVGGNLYIASNANRVRKVNLSSGIIETAVGDPSGPPAAEGAVATEVSINGPDGLFVDSAGNIYFSEETMGTIWKVDTTSGVMHVAVGSGVNGTTGDGLPALQAQINPSGFVLDRAGNIYISEFDKIRKVDVKTGIISRLAGIDFGGVRSGWNIPALTAGLCPGTAIALDAADNVYFGDTCRIGVMEIKFTVKAAVPTLSPPSGTYTDQVTIQFNEVTPEATIYYTADGTMPNAQSQIYTGPITLTSSTNVKAVAVAPGYAPSAIVSAQYTVVPRKVTCCKPIVPVRPAPLL